MPHRLTAHPLVLSALELIALAGLAVVHGTFAVANAISESDWSKLTGPHAAIFVLAMVALGMAWKSREDTKERKTMAVMLLKQHAASAEARAEEAEATERRHVESLEASEKHSSAILALSKEHTESLLQVTAEGTAAINENTSTFKELLDALSHRTCLLGAVGKHHNHESKPCVLCGKVHWKYGPCHPEESPETNQQ